MDALDKRQEREEVYSIVIRAGKRTYFFDVRETRAKEKYLTITESKKRFNNDSGKFFYEKHKLFLYKEDFDKFADGLDGVIDFIKANPGPEHDKDEAPESTGDAGSDFESTKNADELKDDLSALDDQQDAKPDDDSDLLEKEDDKF